MDGILVVRFEFNAAVHFMLWLISAIRFSICIEPSSFCVFTSSFQIICAHSSFMPCSYCTFNYSFCSIKKYLLNRVSPPKSFICINLPVSFSCNVVVFHLFWSGFAKYDAAWVLVLVFKNCSDFYWCKKLIDPPNYAVDIFLIIIAVLRCMLIWCSPTH